MCYAKDQGTKDSSPDERHIAQKPHKDKAAKKYFFTEWGNDNASKQRSISCQWSQLTAIYKNLIVRLQMQVQHIDDVLVQHIDEQDRGKKKHYQGQGGCTIEASES